MTKGDPAPNGGAKAETTLSSGLVTASLGLLMDSQYLRSFLFKMRSWCI